jgi:AraC family transcriptional regulator, arabinose operon regulatory protein
MEHAVLWLTSDQNSKNGIRGIGYREPMGQYLVHRPRGTEDFLLMHFHDPVKILAEGSLREYPAHAFIVWEPDQEHMFGTENRAWVHSWMHCDCHMMESCLKGTGIPLNRPMLLNNAELADRFLSSIFLEVQRSPKPDSIIIKNYVTIWLREVAHCLHDVQHKSEMPQRLVAVVNYINANLEKPMYLEDLAGKAFLSASHFSSEFQKHFHASPINFILELRMQRAAFLLQDANLSLAQIAEKVGFNDAFYFSKQFKKHYSVSPRNYRRKIDAR